MFKFFIFILILFSFSCSKSDSSQNFVLLDGGDTGVNFMNKVTDQENFNILTYRNYYNGGGVAVGDINNDGLQDLFFTANMGQNKLYLNKGEMKFDDISTKAGVGGKNSWTTGVTMVDINSDGLLDIYVCYSGDSIQSNRENELFINKGNLKFEEKAKEYGLNDSGFSTHASFFDFDLDGDLDCYVLNNSYTDPERLSKETRLDYDPTSLGGDRLYENTGSKFVDITKSAGIYSSNLGYGLGVSIGDVTGDLYPDIYISNDFFERDYLYVNNRNGSFSEDLSNRISYTSLASMGSDIADLNNDGFLDIFTTDMLPVSNERIKAANKFDDYNLYNMRAQNGYHYQNSQNCLQINDGEGNFKETAFFSGVEASDWSWGSLIFDMDLDGHKDIFVSNGVYHDITDSDFVDFISDKDQVRKIVEKKGKYDFTDFVKLLPQNKQKNYAFINKGNLKFSNENNNIGLDTESFSNGSAYGDLDNDGDLDLVVNNVNQEAFIYKNEIKNKNNFVQLECKGPKGNLKGIGTTIYSYSGNLKQVNQIMAGRGFQSSVDTRVTIGLGKNTRVDSIRVIWPDKKTELFKNIKTNTKTDLSYKSTLTDYNLIKPKSNQIFKVADITGANHVENTYVDFDNDRLMPHVLSSEGPNLVKGDVNNDKEEDFILQGAKGSVDKLYINRNGTFVLSTQPAFESLRESEKTAGALFDADNDGDLDYLVGMGGNEFKDGVDAFKGIYFENIGANFKIKKVAGLEFQGQISCIKPEDADKDGDIDLFIGARSIPGSYGLSPRSYMLRNNGKNTWEDVTTDATGPLGMVTDACWYDMNNDGFKDIVAVGEWMPVSIILSNKGIPDQKMALKDSFGWWNCIQMTDYNNDGLQDFLLGNWGTNFKLRASIEKPLTAYVTDVDKNKRTDFIMEWYTPVDAKPYPFASKQDLTSQLPVLKKKGLKYHEYAKMDVNELFSEKVINDAFKLTVTYFESSVLLNKNGDYALEALPLEAQLSPIFAFVNDDFDKDGISDIFFGGNYYKLKPEIGRLDGFNGGYFKGSKNGNYQFTTANNSGLAVKGELRDAIIIRNKLILGMNNDNLKVFSF